MNVLVIDNYDSFTYNIVQYLQELGAKTVVYRNDQITLSQLKQLNFQRAVISPGPGRPKDGGISCSFIEAFYKKIPLLGVCLGHQCIGHLFGGRIIKAPIIMHGKTSFIHHQGQGVFKGMAQPFSATRYHSLIIERDSLPKNLIITAETDDGIIMGIKERNNPLYGVQFHPESILTDEGKKLLNNFISI